MNTTLTTLIQLHAYASRRLDRAVADRNAARDLLPVGQRAPYERTVTEYAANLADARRRADAEYAKRHDLHVASDRCETCGPREYDLYSVRATDEERRAAAALNEDSARMLGVTA